MDILIILHHSNQENIAESHFWSSLWTLWSKERKLKRRKYCFHIGLEVGTQVFIGHTGPTEPKVLFQRLDLFRRWLYPLSLGFLDDFFAQVRTSHSSQNLAGDKERKVWSLYHLIWRGVIPNDAESIANVNMRAWFSATIYCECRAPLWTAPKRVIHDTPQSQKRMKWPGVI